MWIRKESHPPPKREPDHNVISGKDDFGFFPMGNREPFKYFMQGIPIRLMFWKHHSGNSLKKINWGGWQDWRQSPVRKML